MNPLIKIQNLKKSYKNGLDETFVFGNLNFEMYPKDAVAICGESGSGKTTLLKIIGSLDSDWNGEVEVCGLSLKNISDKNAENFRLKKIGFVFQTHYFLPQFTILENILLPALPTGLDVEDRALSLLEKAGVLDLKNRFINELSGGQLQRAAVVRALINSPEIMIADEPTGALDEKSAHSLIEFLHELNAEGLSIILSTHSKVLANSMKKILTILDGNLS